MSNSWLPIPPTSHFSLANIPFGLITHALASAPHPAIAIGDYALDLSLFAQGNGFSSLPSLTPHLAVFHAPSLNPFAALGRPLHREVRTYLQAIFAADTPFPDRLQLRPELRAEALVPLAEVRCHLPLQIGDYTDFYAGKNHAFNVGVLFRGAANALQPNYTHLPVGYHGRASSVVVSGTPIRRPCGQILEGQTPVFAACRKLDIELELGAFVCRSSKMGERIPIAEAEEYLFGYVLLNDWSARDVQAWEYVPLGPFNGKNFGTTISAWIVLPDALEKFRCRGLENETQLLPYLREERAETAYDLRLEVDITTLTGHTTTITRTNSKNLLFSFPQMLTHHSVTGCPMNVGDLLGSGTISGTEPGTQGSFLEQCENGKGKIRLEAGEERTFLEDGDCVALRGWAGEEGSYVGFGECMGRIEAAVGV